MTSFAPAFEFLMRHEDPGLTGKVTRDSGGLTRWGISQNAYPDLDIANLQLEEAGNIYRNDYFKPIRGYDYKSQDVANKLLDAAVNMGVHMAGKLAQECAVLCGARRSCGWRNWDVHSERHQCHKPNPVSGEIPGTFDGALPGHRSRTPG